MVHKLYVNTVTHSFLYPVDRISSVSELIEICVTTTLRTVMQRTSRDEMLRRFVAPGCETAASSRATRLAVDVSQLASERHSRERD